MMTCQNVSVGQAGKSDRVSQFVMHFPLENIYISVAISLEPPEERQIERDSQVGGNPC